MSLDCHDKSLLMAYLYGECDATEREAFERHLDACPACRMEVAELRSVREVLQEWSPPETALDFRIVSGGAPPGTPVVPFKPRSRWSAVPAWARLAAAVLVLAVGAAIANLDVRFGNGGVTIRTGWQSHAAASEQASGQSAQPWRADLAAFEQNLRRELRPTPIAAPLGGSPGTNSVVGSPGFSPGTPPTTVQASNGGRGLSAAETTELARRFQTLIDDSERRQQQTFEHLLATRLVQFARDVDAQRRSDLVRIQQGLGQVDTRTTSEIARMREMQRYLMGVANIQEIK